MAIGTQIRSRRRRAKTFGDGRSGGVPVEEQIAEPAGRCAGQVVPASAIASPVTRVRMLNCDKCARTFLNFEGLDQEKAPGKHRCGGQLRWVWVE